MYPSQVSKSKEICETIYFGGGTPSILEVDDLLMIFDALRYRSLGRRACHCSCSYSSVTAKTVQYTALHYAALHYTALH